MNFNSIEKVTPQKDEADIDPYNPTMVLNLLQGTNDWANIQDIVKLTFKAIFDVVKSHGEALRDLEAITKDIPNKSEIASLLSSKANNADIQNSIAEITNIVESKIGIEDVKLLLTENTKNISDKIEEINAESNNKLQSIDQEITRITNELENRANKQHVQNAIHRKANKTDVEASLNAKADAAIVSQIKEDATNTATQYTTIKKSVDESNTKLSIQEQRIREIQSQLEQSIANMEKKFTNKIEIYSKSNPEKSVNTNALDQFETKIDALQKKCESFMEESNNILNGMQNTISNESILLTSKITGILDIKVEALSKTIGCIEKDYNTSVNEIKERLRRNENSLGIKLELNDAQKLITNCNTELANQIEQIKNDTKSMIQFQEEEWRKELDKKISVHEVSTILIEKADKTEMMQALSEKLDKIHFKGLNDSIDDLAEKTKIFDKGLSIITQLQDKVESFNKELVKKSDIKDVCTLLDMKAGIDDVNKSLLEIHTDVMQRTKAQEDLIRNTSQQMQAMDNANINGRWIWKTGELKGGNGIPWELQVCNTAPQTFLWEKDKTGIVVSEEGVYEVCLAIFTTGKPNMQLLVNGEPINLETKGAQTPSYSSSIGRAKSMSAKKGISGTNLRQGLL